MMIVDWEYAGMGDPRFDLGNLSVNNDFDERHRRAAAERLRRRAAHAMAQRAALKLMRVLSDAREARLGRRAGESSPSSTSTSTHYADEHFERLRAAVREPDFEEWLAAARGRAETHGQTS